MTFKLAYKGGSPLRLKSFMKWPIFEQHEETLLFEVLHSGNWSFNGPKELEFSQKFSEFCHVKYGHCVANGSVSLEIALRALGIGPGDEVIIPSLTWMATALAAVNVGATPIMADVNINDWCLNVDQLETLITTKTKAIIPVHLYSQMTDMDKLLPIADKYKLAIVEDCAHAHGARWNGKGAGSLGTIGSFSFQQSKPMTSGEGGFVTTNDESLAQKLYSLKNCGRPWKSGLPSKFGNNYRMTEFQAAVLLGQLMRFPQQIDIKGQNLQLFTKLIKDLPGLSLLPQKPQVSNHGIYGVPLLFESEAFGNISRDLLINVLKAEGLPIMAPYEVLYKASNWVEGKSFVNWGKDVDVEKRLGLKSYTPVAETISSLKGLVLNHQLFLGPEQDIYDAVAIFKKVQDNVGELSFDKFKIKSKEFIKRILK